MVQESRVKRGPFDKPIVCDGMCSSSDICRTKFVVPIASLNVIQLAWQSNTVFNCKTQHIIMLYRCKVIFFIPKNMTAVSSPPYIEILALSLSATKKQQGKGIRVPSYSYRNRSGTCRPMSMFSCSL